jgi:hypothetical protein
MDINLEQIGKRSIDDILELEERYQRDFGCKPFNLSLWDAAKPFQVSLLERLELPLCTNLMNYEFSDLLNCRDEIIKRFGYNTSVSDCLITPTGSISILCVLNWLQNIGIKKLHVLCPCYYTIIPLCKKFGIKTQKIFLTKTGKGFELEGMWAKTLANSKAIWLDNPIYCTGVTLSENIIEYLRNFLEQGGIVITDECLAPLGTELGRRLGDYPFFIGIHCPHKLLLMNSLKFSTIVFDRKYQHFFKYWSDVIYGSLLTSNIIAIEHFLSKNFDLLYKQSLIMILRSLENVRNVFKPFDSFFILDRSLGHLISGYMPSLNSSFGDNKEFLWKVFRNSGTSFIPGTRYFFNPEGGFCFKINLARDNEIFRASLKILLNYLDKSYSMAI